jgi:hypothetical protein
VLVAVEIAVTVAALRSRTSMMLPSGAIAMAHEPPATGIAGPGVLVTIEIGIPQSDIGSRA